MARKGKGFRKGSQSLSTLKVSRKFQVEELMEELKSVIPLTPEEMAQNAGGWNGWNTGQTEFTQHEYMGAQFNWQGGGGWCSQHSQAEQDMAAGAGQMTIGNFQQAVEDFDNAAQCTTSTHHIEIALQDAQSVAEQAGSLSQVLGDEVRGTQDYLAARGYVPDPQGRTQEQLWTQAGVDLAEAGQGLENAGDIRAAYNDYNYSADAFAGAAPQHSAHVLKEESITMSGMGSYENALGDTQWSAQFYEQAAQEAAASGHHEMAANDYVNAGNEWLDTGGTTNQGNGSNQHAFTDFSNAVGAVTGTTAASEQTIGLAEIGKVTAAEDCQTTPETTKQMEKQMKFAIKELSAAGDTTDRNVSMILRQILPPSLHTVSSRHAIAGGGT